MGHSLGLSPFWGGGGIFPHVPMVDVAGRGAVGLPERKPEKARGYDVLPEAARRVLLLVSSFFCFLSLSFSGSPVWHGGLGSSS